GHFLHLLHPCGKRVRTLTKSGRSAHLTGTCTLARSQSQGGRKNVAVQRGKARMQPAMARRRCAPAPPKSGPPSPCLWGGSSNRPTSCTDRSTALVQKITPLRQVERFGQSLAQSSKQVFQKNSSFYCSQKLTRLV